jgi:hypothetical protein
MKRFIEGEDRGLWTLLPQRLDDWISEDNPVRAIDAFVASLDLAKLGFKVQPAETGRPSFHRQPVHRAGYRSDRCVLNFQPASPP